MGFAPAVCFNKGWREHTKGGVDQKRGESQGHRRGNLPCFSFCPPLSGFFHFPKSFFYIPKFLSSPLLSSLSLDPFGTLSKYFFPGESFPAFSVPGCNMSANFLCEGVEKPLNFVSIILSLWQIFKNPSTHIGILGKCVTLHLFVAFTFAFTKCEWMMHFTKVVQNFTDKPKGSAASSVCEVYYLKFHWLRFDQTWRSDALSGPLMISGGSNACRF